MIITSNKSSTEWGQVLGDDVPVHHGLGARAGRGVGDIGPAHGKRSSQDDAENETHWNPPCGSRHDAA